MLKNYNRSSSNKWMEKEFCKMHISLALQSSDQISCYTRIVDIAAVAAASFICCTRHF